MTDLETESNGKTSGDSTETGTVKQNRVKFSKVNFHFVTCKSPDLYLKKPTFCTKIHFKTFTY